MTAILVGLLGLALVGIVALLVRDRRGRRALERKRRRIRELEAAVEELGAAQERFFDLVTHELRSPLSAILGYQELLEDGVYGNLDPDAAEPLERIGRSARHLVNLVEGLVELTRLRTGTLRPDLEPLDLGVLLSSVADAFRTQLQERGLEPTVHMPDTLPSVRTDRDRLLRTFDLLVTSASKHPADHGLTLHVTRLDDGAAARITGTSIQIHDDADDPAARVGIRLAIASATAELLGGELALDIDDQRIHALELRIRGAPDAGPAAHTTLSSAGSERTS